MAALSKADRDGNFIAQPVKPRRLAQEQQWRTTRDKIERLRTRLKQLPMDANVRAILLGVLDLLGDEL